LSEAFSTAIANSTAVFIVVLELETVTEVIAYFVPDGSGGTNAPAKAMLICTGCVVKGWPALVGVIVTGPTTLTGTGCWGVLITTVSTGRSGPCAHAVPVSVTARATQVSPHRAAADAAFSV
jgi:hypothetical protein